MNNGKITYAELTAKLADLGYRQVRTIVQQKPTRIYEHQEIEDATMFLPDGDDQEPVPVALMAKVQLILRTYGICEIENTLSA